MKLLTLSPKLRGLPGTEAGHVDHGHDGDDKNADGSDVTLEISQNSGDRHIWESTEFSALGVLNDYLEKFPLVSFHVLPIAMSDRRSVPPYALFLQSFRTACKLRPQTLGIVL